MNIKQFTFNPFQENTFVIYTDEKEAMIVDPGCYSGAEENRLKEFIESNQLIVKQVVNTHLHIDHALGNAFTEETWGIKACANAGDDFWLKGMAGQARMFGLELRRNAPPIGTYLNEGDQIKLGQEVFDIFQVPGHSPGSIVLYNAANHCIFAGDVLFDGSIGRTDLQGGNYGELIEGIQTKLLTLPDETDVYSGHGPATTIGRERVSNPYI
jgi:hydroxyacylglutathione hydrolase